MKVQLVGFLFIFLCSFQGLVVFAQQNIYVFERDADDLHSFLNILSSVSPQPVSFSLDRIPNRTIMFRAGRKSEQQVFDFLKSHGLRVISRGKRISIVPFQKPLISKFTVSGFARDKKTGKALIGANIFVSELKSGVSTNEYGYYSLTLSKGKYHIRSSFVGYNPDSLSVNLTTHQHINIELSESPVELGVVTIASKPSSFNVESMVPGINTLDFNTENHIPYFMGEVDVFQGALLLPGIQILGEEANGINVRGGQIDENLILLDEAPIYNPTHYFGLVSVFNPETVNDVQFLKGFFPPKYGGRASSVISIHHREGNNQNHRVLGGIGLLSARLSVEGPLKKGKSSFLVSGRQSLLNPTKLVNADLQSDFKTLFTDVNFKANWLGNQKNTFFLSGYFGNDRNVTGFGTERRWGNRTVTFRWNHQSREKLFSHFSATYSEYNYRVTEPREAGSFVGRFGVTDYTVKMDQSYYDTPRSHINFGFSATLHRLRPGERLPFDPDDTATNPLELDAEHGLESGIYASHDVKLSRNLKILYGVRLSSLINIGPTDVFLYAPNRPKSERTITDTLSVGVGGITDTHWNIEPRVSVNYGVNQNTALKAAYNRSFQYIHLISNTVTPSPIDIWKLSSRYIPPGQTNHFSLGLFKNFREDQWESYVDVFYKHSGNKIDYKDGANLFFNDKIETETVNAEARTYGLEFFLKRNFGKTRGWLSYTLSKTERRTTSAFEEEQINHGRFFPDDNDKTHDVSLVVLHNLSGRLNLSASFNYSTGRPVTLPIAKYNFEGNPIPHFADRNRDRLPDYHRLDLSLRWNGRAVKKDGTARKFGDYWTLTLYNAYARKNVFSYFFRESESDPGETEIIRYSVFGSIIPAVTYNFNF